MTKTSGTIVKLVTNPNFRPSASAQIYRVVQNKLRHFNQAKVVNIKAAIGVSAEGDVPVTDDGTDVEYYANVSVGTPKQNFKLDFDTGSSDLWFCSTLGDSSESSKNKYDPTKSSTYKKDGRPWKISYGDVSLAGYMRCKKLVCVVPTKLKWWVSAKIGFNIFRCFRNRHSISWRSCHKK